MKVCTKCKEEKELTEYYKTKTGKDGVNSRCKVCCRQISKDWVSNEANRKKRDAYMKIWKQKRKEKDRAYKDRFKLVLRISPGQKLCGKCKDVKSLSEFTTDRGRHDGKNQYCKSCSAEMYNNYRLRNIEKVLAKTRLWRKLHTDTLNEKRRQQYSENSEYYAAQSSEWARKNRDKVNERARKRREECPEVRLLTRLRARVYGAVKNGKKSARTRDLLGCDNNVLKAHLQKTAELNGYSDFNINTYSSKEYHIDHIIPCAAFNLMCGYHQRLCFHYTNLQILTAKENLKKQAKYLTSVLQ